MHAAWFARWPKIAAAPLNGFTWPRALLRVGLSTHTLCFKMVNDITEKIEAEIEESKQALPKGQEEGACKGKKRADRGKNGKKGMKGGGKGSKGGTNGKGSKLLDTFPESTW